MSTILFIPLLACPLSMLALMGAPAVMRRVRNRTAAHEQSEAVDRSATSALS